LALHKVIVIEYANRIITYGSSGLPKSYAFIIYDLEGNLIKELEPPVRSINSFEITKDGELALMGIDIEDKDNLASVLIDANGDALWKYILPSSSFYTLRVSKDKKVGILQTYFNGKPDYYCELRILNKRGELVNTIYADWNYSSFNFLANDKILFKRTHNYCIYDLRLRQKSEKCFGAPEYYFSYPANGFDGFYLISTKGDLLLYKNEDDHYRLNKKINLKSSIQSRIYKHKLASNEDGTIEVLIGNKHWVFQ